MAHSTVSGGRPDRRSSAGLPTSRASRRPFHTRGDPSGRLLDIVTHPVAAATVVAAVLHLLWLGPAEQWTELHAPKPGIYRIAAPYTLPRGTTCPANMIG